MHGREKTTGTLTLSLAWNQTEIKTYLNRVKIPKLKHAGAGGKNVTNNQLVCTDFLSVAPSRLVVVFGPSKGLVVRIQILTELEAESTRDIAQVQLMCWLQTFQMNRSKWRLWRSLNKEIWTKIRRQERNRRTKHRSNDCRIGCCHRCPLVQELVTSVAMVQEKDRTSLEIPLTFMDWQSISSNFIHVSTFIFAPVESLPTVHTKSEGSHLWKSEGSVVYLNRGRHAQTTLPSIHRCFFQSVSGIGYEVQVFKSESHKNTKICLWIPDCFRIHISLEDRVCLVCLLVKCWLAHLLCLFTDPLSRSWFERSAIFGDCQMMLKDPWPMRFHFWGGNGSWITKKVRIPVVVLGSLYHCLRITSKPTNLTSTQHQRFVECKTCWGSRESHCQCQIE